MNKQRKILVTLFVFFSIFVASLISKQDTYAVDYSSIQSKWMYTQYFQCLKSNNTVSEITNITGNHKVIEDIFLRSGTMYMPSYNLSGTPTYLNCREIALGKTGLTGSQASGVLSAYKNVTWNSKAASENLMTNILKYSKIESTSTSETNGSFSIKAIRTKKTCTGISANNCSEKSDEIGSAAIKVSTNADGSTHYGTGPFWNFGKDIEVGWINNRPEGDYLTVKIGAPESGCRPNETFYKEFALTKNPQTLYNNIESALVNQAISYTCEHDTNNTSRTTYYTYAFSLDGTDLNIVDSTDAAGYQKLNNSANNSLFAISPYDYMTTVGTAGIRFNPTEYYNLYTYYLSRSVGSSGSVSNSVTCNPSDTRNLTSVKLIDSDGSIKTCYANFNGKLPNNITVYTQAYSSGSVSIEAITMQTVLDWLNNESNLANVEVSEINSVESLDPSVNTPPGSSSTTEGGDSQSTLSVCFQAAGALGWLMCPVLSVVGEATKFLYNEIVRPFLEIDAANLLSQSNGVYSGWTTFRNVANVVFAILFVIVILSQVTGFGLNNYNIKKILPRLIAVAILVNISFLICQLAVDLSNILGNGLQSLFKGLSTNLTFTGIDGNPTSFTLDKVIEGVLGQIMSVGAVVGVFGGLATIKLWIFPFLLTLFGCIISIIFFFIILAVRQAGVIILVVLAPVAIVCYALPNTKSFFDRWKKLFISLLLVYPICGLIMGGGQYAASLLLASSDGSFFYTLAAMLLSVVPFFMIPSILKSSMAAMGNLGMKISNFGRGIGGGTTRAVRGSEWGKNVQRQNQLGYDEKTAKRLEAKIASKGDRASNGLRRRAYIHRAAANRAYMEDYRAQATVGSIAPGTPGGDAMLNKFQAEQLDFDTKNQRSNYESTINTQDASAVGEEYFNQLEALRANPTDREALTKMRALQDILMESDPGRTQIKNQQLRHAQRHQDYYSSDAAKTEDSALKLAAAHMLNAHQGEIKKSNRGTWAMQQAFNRRDFEQLYSNGGVSTRDAQGAEVSPDQTDKIASYGSSYYERAGLDGYDENTLTAADEDVIKGINRGLASGSIAGGDRSTIASLASGAYGKEHLSVQPKIAKQLREAIIRSTDSSTIGGTNVRALNRLADDIKQGTLSAANGADQQALIQQLTATAQGALTGNKVTDAEHAAALNNILKAAGQKEVAWNGTLNTQGQGGSQSGSSGRVRGGIIDVTGDLSGDQIRRRVNGDGSK